MQAYCRATDVARQLLPVLKGPKRTVIEGSYTPPRKTLGRNYIIPNIRFPERAFSRNYISLNMHLPEITFS